MMMLPETTRTPLGFTVEGASAELLEQLLDEYAFELKSKSRRIFDALQKGLSESQIRDQLGAIGLAPPAEVVIWWKWRNGFTSGFGHGLRHGQMRLEDAILIYKNEVLGTDVEQWNPHWLRVAGGGNAGDAIDCAPSLFPPRVRAVSTFDIGTQDDEDPLRQVVSLCTPVTWWLLSISKGWNVYDPSTRLWKWEVSAYPLEWKMTNLM